MDFGTPPPMWQEPPVFCLPGVPSPQTSWSLKAHAVLIHGIDGTTYPDLGHSVLLPAFVGESETLRFSYSPSEVAGASATEETISLVATNLLELLRTRVAPATTLAGKDVDDSSLSIMFFAYDLGGTIVKEALTRASLDEQYRPVLEASSLVVFYGTPHSSWAGNTLRILHYCFRGLLQEWVPDFFERMTAYQKRLSDTFGNLAAAARFRVLNVCQKQTGSPLCALITHSSSALLGIRGEVRLQVERSHFQLAIPLSYEEREYMRGKILDAVICHCRPYRILVEALTLGAGGKIAASPSLGKHRQRRDEGKSVEDSNCRFLANQAVAAWRGLSGGKQRALRMVLGHDINFDEFCDAFASQVAEDESEPMERILLRLGPRGEVGFHTTYQAFASLCLQFLEQRPSISLWARHLYPNLRDALLGVDERWKHRVLARCLRTLFLAPRRGPTQCLIYLDAGASTYGNVIGEILSLMEESEIQFDLLAVTPPKIELDSTALSTLQEAPCVDLSPQDGNSPSSSVEHKPEGQISESTADPYEATQSSIERLSRCIDASVACVLRALAWTVFALRPLSDTEIKEAIAIASCGEGGDSPPTRPHPTEAALLLALELYLPGQARITEQHVIWTAPELSSHLKSEWRRHFGDDGLTPDLYLSQACLSLIAPRFQTANTPASTEGQQQEQQLPGLSQYAVEYWIEHQIRAGQSPHAITKTQPGFDSIAWIRHLSSSTWSANVAEDVRVKFQPDAIQKAFGINSSDACYIAYRMAVLPLSVEDSQDWILFEIAGQYLPEDTFAGMVETLTKTTSTESGQSSSLLLQRILAGAENHVYEHLVTSCRLSAFVLEHFVDILLTATAIGNATAVATLLAMAPQYGWGHQGEERSPSRIGTALQVACEYGDGEVAERILAGHHELHPLELETSYPWNALHIACHQGHRSLVEAIGQEHREGNIKISDAIAPPSRLDLLLVASARGLYKITKALTAVVMKTASGDGRDRTNMSAVQIASQFGFSSTLRSLFNDHNCKISPSPLAEKGEQEKKNSAAVLVSRSGDDKATILVLDRFMRETVDAFHELLPRNSLGEASTARAHDFDDDDANNDGDSGHGAAENTDPLNRLIGNANKIMGEALLTMVETRGLQLKTFQNLLGYLRDPSRSTDAKGRTSLLLAARAGALDLVEQLHCSRDHVEMDDKQRTAMHYACYYGHWDVVEFLLQAQGVEYSLTARDAASATPVTAAAMGGYFHIVEQLLPRLSPEDLRAEFTLAVQKDLLGAMDLILKSAARMDPSGRAEYIQTKDEDGYTPLQLAAMHNQPRIIQFLLLRQPGLDDARLGTTALGFAAGLSGIESMRLLLDAGASPEVPTRRGRSILSEAIYYEHPDPTRLLLACGASMQLPRYWNHYSNLLEFTLSMSSPAVLKVLLEHIEGLRKNIKVGPVPDYMTPTEILRLVVQEGSPYMFAVVRQAWPRDVFDATMSSKSGLAFGKLVENAAAIGTAETLQQIYGDVGGHVDVNDTKGGHGTALQAAAGSRRDALAKLNMLIALGAKLDTRVEQETEEVVDGSRGPATTTRSRLLGYWGTALHAAARSGNQDVVAALVNLQDDLKDQPDMMGRLPLHLAAMQGNWEAVLELSSLSSKHTSEDYQGRNALHMACGLGKTDLVLKLLSSMSRADSSQIIDKPDMDGWTPLHWACRSRDAQLVETLLARNAAPDKAADSPKGWLPYHIAVEYGWGGDMPQKVKDACNDSQDVAEDLPKDPKEFSYSSCDCCHCKIYGARYKCKSGAAACDDFDLCQKCWTHVTLIHAPDHEFELYGLW